METQEPQEPNASTNATPQGKPRRRFLAGLVTGGLLGSLLAGGASVLSHAHPGPGMFGHGHGRWGQHWRGAAAPGERAEFAADWVLSRVDASTEQKQQIKTMLQKAFQELQPLREQHMQNRQALVTALTQPAVDRDALDMLRQAELQLAEQASQQVVATLADIAEVLTPEQRASLVDMVSRLHD